MAGQADGSIIIDTEIDPEGFRAGSAELQRAIKSLSATVNNLGPLFQKALGGNERAIDSFKSKAAALEETISQLEAKMENLADKPVKMPVDSSLKKELAQAEKTIAAAEAKLKGAKAGLQEYYSEIDRAKQNTDSMLQNANTSEQVDRVLEIEQQELDQINAKYSAQLETVKQITANLEAQKQKQAEISQQIAEQKARPAIKGSETAEYQQMAAQLEAAKQKLGDMKGRLQESSGEASRLSSHAQTFSSHIGNAAKTIAGKLVSGIRSAAGSMWRMVTHSRSMSGQFGSLISGAQRFAIGLLGAEGILTLLRRAVGAYMAENQQLANTLSSCWSGIGNILGPIISWIIDLVATAVAYVTAFLRLFGVVGKSTVKAITGAGNAAAGAAKELKRQLASFDELNILNDTSSGGGGGGGGGGGAGIDGGLPDVELPDWAKLMAEQIKNGDWSGAGVTLGTALNGLIDNFDWAGWGRKIGTGIQNGISFALGFLRTVHWEGLGAGIATFLNNGIASINPNDLGALLASKLRIMVDIAFGFVTTFDWINFGEWLAGIINGWFAEIDWIKAAKTLSLGLLGAIKSAVAFLQKTNWKQIGKDLGDFLANIEWGDILNGLWDVLKEAGSALMDFLDGLHDGLGDLLPIVEAIAIAFGAWKIGSGIVTGLDKIFGLFDKKGVGQGKGFQIPSPKTILKGMADLGIIILGIISLVEIINVVSKIPGFDEAMNGGLEVIKDVFGGLGSVALQITAASAGIVALGKVGVKAVVKGLGNLSLILAGVPVVVTAIGALLSFRGFQESLETGAKSIKTAFIALEDIAIQIAIASAGIAVLGKIGVSAVLKGLIGFAAILGGVPAVITAIGALMSTEGFEEAMGSGLQAIKTAFVGIGEAGVQIALTSAGIAALGKIGISAVLQGFVGFAAILAGVPAVITGIGALLSTDGFSEFLGAGVESIKTAFTGLADVGLQIGVLSAVIVGLGFATPATVLSGLLGFAAIITGLELILVALGELQQDPSFSWIVGEGGKALMQLGEILGGFAGSIIEGAMTKISEGFPKIAENLSQFAQKLEPFLTAMGKVDGGVADAAKNLAGAILAFSGASLIDAVTSWITGGKSLVDFGEQLAQFGPKFAEYATSVTDVKPEVIQASASAAKSMIELSKELPGSGGILQMIMGEQDIGKFGESLKTFGQCFAEYAQITDGITPDVVSASVAAADSLIALAKDIPTSGGLAALLFGDSGMGAFGNNLKSFGESFKAYYDSISGITITTITGATGAITGLINAAIAAKEVDNKQFKEFGKAVEDFGKKLSGTDWGSVSSGFSSGLSTMLTSLTGAISGMKSSMEGLENDLATVWENIVTTAITKWEETRTKIGESNDSISRDTSQKWEGIKKAFILTWDGIRTTAKTKFELIRGEIKGAWENVGKDTVENWKNIAKTIFDKVEEIKRTTEDGFDKVKGNIVDKTADAMNEVTKQNWYSIGTYIVTGIVSGINDSAWRITSAMSNLAQNALIKAQTSLKINSPSRVFRDEVGWYIGLGIGAGVEDSTPQVLKSVSGVADAISEEMNAGDFALKATVPTAEVDGALTDFTDKISGSFTNLLDRLQAIAEKVTFRVPDAAYSMVPYRPAAVAAGGRDVGAAIEASNDELIAAVSQMVLNATASIVAAIETHSGPKINIDKSAIGQIAYEEIKRRSRMAGKFVLEE